MTKASARLENEKFTAANFEYVTPSDLMPNEAQCATGPAKIMPRNFSRKGGNKPPSPVGSVGQQQTGG